MVEEVTMDDEDELACLVYPGENAPVRVDDEYWCGCRNCCAEIGFPTPERPVFERQAAIPATGQT